MTTARWAGVRVETFSLGFGPRIAGLRRGPTDYRLSLVPLGGYVKMAGEIPIADPARAGELKPDELAAKGVGARAAIFSAGVAMNTLFAFVVFPLAFHVGVPLLSPEVGLVEIGSGAWEAGLLPGDRVLRADGRAVFDFEDIVHIVTLAGPGQDIALEVERAGERRTVRLPPAGRDPRHLGIQPRVSRYAAQEDVADLWRRGEVIRSVEGLDPAVFFGLQPNRPDSVLPVRVLLDDGKGGATREVSLAPKPRDGTTWMIGVSPVLTPIKKLREGARFRDLRVGDRIVRVDGREVRSQTQLQEAVWKAPGPSLRFEAERGEGGGIVAEEVEATGIAERGALLNDFYGVPGLEVVGNPDSPAVAAGLQDGDRLVALGGREMKAWGELNEEIQKSEGRPIQVDVTRSEGPDGEARVRLSVTPRKLSLPAPALAEALDAPWAMTTVRFPFPQSIGAGVHYAGRWMLRIVEMLKGIFTARIKPQNLQGIIQIARFSYHKAEQGPMALFFFMAILSLNLAVINLLPIPILDGGWLLFLLVEKIKGSPVSTRTLGISQWAGLIFLLGVFLYVTRNDILQVFFRGG